MTETFGEIHRTSLEHKRKGYYPVEALESSGNGKTTYFISAKLIKDIEEDLGRSHQYYNLFSAYDVLNEPTHIYEGLDRVGYEQALCYVGRPKRYGKDWSAPPSMGWVFLVCITMHQVVFEWRWEKADELDNEIPRNIRTRFTRLKWKLLSSI